MAEENEAGEGYGETTASGRYEALAMERLPYLERARRYSALTIPGLMPPEGSSGATQLTEPFQSLGADGVNNLSSKLLLVLFPPGSSFFRLRLEDKLAAQAGDDKQEFEDALAKVEQSITNRMETKGNRSIRFEALKHLLVTGNGLTHVLPDGREKFFPLDRYVICRDLDDNVLEIVVKETLARSALPDKVKAILTDQTTSYRESKKSVDLYTWIQRSAVRQSAGWIVYQEVEGKQVPGSRGTYPAAKLPWIPLRWSRVPGEAYGRGRCEEYAGDLTSLEGLTKAILMYAAACAKILFLTRPGGHANPEDLQKAQSGDFVEGSDGDVKALQIDKFADFQTAKAVADKCEQRLQKAFLMASAVQRDAERVTAEEIRVMIGQLEETLGGQYALLAEDYQRSLVVIHLVQMQKRGEVNLPDNSVQPQIVSGLEGLGRNSDLNKLDAFVQGAEQLFGPQVLPQYVNPGEYLRRRATALGIDAKNLVRSDDEVQQNQQAAQQQAMTEKIAPNLVTAGAAAAQQNTPNEGA